jgi:Raf kinase inhibitor-like YbhB/YbcL family protein
LKFTSTAFYDGGLLPQRFTCDGSGVSPPFRWDDVPPNTYDFTLICEDPDAPNGVFTHWLLYNIPAGTRKLEEGLPHDEVLSMGAKQGTNDFGQVGYGPACPPRLRKHHYIFTLYALDVTDLLVPPGVRRQHVIAAMKGHVIAEAKITAIYER